MSLENIRNERIKKLEILRSKNIDPYPAKVRRDYALGKILKEFTKLERTEKKVALAGRIWAKREHGKATFADLRDESGKLQLYFKKDKLGYAYDLFLDTVDIGDFLEVKGKLFKTQKKEPTLEVVAWKIISKSLRPLPEKWHGLQDVEERFRKRYLDILMNPEVRSRFETRSILAKTLRGIFEKEEFLEVETPYLHSIPGGALARPFVTHHNALDIDLYLRIAPELYLKRLLVAGFEKVYEFGKSFRNEGIDANHNPEFTEPECYAAYWDENDMMKFVEKMILTLIKTVFKKTEFEYQGKKIKFQTPFARITFQDLLSRYALITDYESETQDSMRIRAKQFGIDTDGGVSKGKIADEIYKKICRPYLVQPTFVINHPTEISPLAKSFENDPKRVRRFQLVAAGMELMNGFAELNDPLGQKIRFQDQEKNRAGGEEEAHRTDEDFIEALEYGMPPAAGLGIGFDRLVMLLTNAKNIREVVLFPTLRPK